MTLSFERFDALLRSALRPRDSSPDVVSDAAALGLRPLLALVAGGGAFAGAVMGSFPLFNGGSFGFLLLSALKLPLFLGLAALLIYPAMRMLYTLLGLSDEWPLAVRALAGGQATLAATLASLAPFTLVAYASGLAYRHALLWNVGLFAVAGAIAGRGVLGRLAQLIRREPRHLRLWQIGFGLWAFVAVQLAWNLRPFIGAPSLAPQFFRPDAFTNAYLALWKIVVG